MLSNDRASSVSTNDEICSCQRSSTVLSSSSTLTLPNIAILIFHLRQNASIEQCRKICSVDLSLISYGFLIRLINRLFDLNSNFTVMSQNQQMIQDDFDLDNYLITFSSGRQSTLGEFFIDRCSIDDWLIIDENSTENFHLFDVDELRVIVTICSSLSSSNRHETFFQRATNWIHRSVQQNASNRCLTKKDFSQMFDPLTGRLINESLFRQRIFEDGCETSIRRLAWCYLFRIFDQSMTNDDRKAYGIKTTERYAELKKSWQNRNEPELLQLENLIQKDVTRTDSSVKFFGNKTFLSQKKLLDILLTYCVHHADPGYVQGMTDMAAPILYVIRDEPLSYDCFCALMRHMNRLFHSDGQAIRRRLDLLRKTLRAIDIELWTKIERCDIGNLMFAYRWVLLDCKREFPFKDIFRVFETIWSTLTIDRFDFHDDQTSLDGGDSGCCDLQLSRSEFDFLSNAFSSIVFDDWLKDFTTIDDDETQSDMFTIFLCVGLLEQNRTSILQIPSNVNCDDDDQIGTYFSRLVRQNDAQQTLQLARHYYQQYLTFQIRLKHLFEHNH